MPNFANLDAKFGHFWEIKITDESQKVECEKIERQKFTRQNSECLKI